MNHVDYKDVEALKKFVNAHGRIQSHKRTSLPSKEQRQIAMAIKRARFMGLLPYVSR